jgi:hypothetical protein
MLSFLMQSYKKILKRPNLSSHNSLKFVNKSGFWAIILENLPSHANNSDEKVNVSSTKSTNPGKGTTKVGKQATCSER